MYSLKRNLCILIAAGYSHKIGYRTDHHVEICIDDGEKTNAQGSGGDFITADSDDTQVCQYNDDLIEVCKQIVYAYRVERSRKKMIEGMGKPLAHLMIQSISFDIRKFVDLLGAVGCILIETLLQSGFGSMHFIFVEKKRTNIERNQQ